MKNEKIVSRTIIKCEAFGREIRIWIHDTGQGINVLMEGGDQGHIGAVGIAEPGMETKVITFPGHREEAICRKWATVLAAKYNAPVVVEAGIHFNQITKEEIQEVLRILEKELERFLI